MRLSSGRTRPLPPEARYPARDPRVRSRSIALASGEPVRLVEAGEAGAEPVLLFHGWAGSVYNFRHLLPLLAEGGRRAIAVDLRGHGLSDRPNDASTYSSSALLQYALDVMDALELWRATLVGHSMAGALVVDLLQRDPSRLSGVVLLAPIGFSRIARVTVARALRIREWLPGRAPRWAVKLVLRRMYGVRRTFDEHDVDEYWSALQHPQSLAALFALAERYDWSIRQWAAVPVSVPLRIVFGQRDRLVTAVAAAARARTVRGASVTVVEGAGHMLAEEVPEEVAREILSVAPPD